MIAGNMGPVEPHALRRAEPNFVESLFDGRSALPSAQRDAMLEMMRAVKNAIDPHNLMNPRVLFE